jgi:serine/threonine protein kinase
VFNPTGKHDSDEPSGDVAVQSDSASSSHADSRLNPGIYSGQTADLTPAPPAKTASKRAAPAMPASFGRYEVQNALGAGGFGAVYRGHHTQLERPVAIKVLRGGPEVPKAEAEQFLQEARRLAQLSHPGIVAVHDVGLDQGQIYIISDFLDGPHLGRWL